MDKTGQKRIDTTDAISTDDRDEESRFLRKALGLEEGMKVVLEVGDTNIRILTGSDFTYGQLVAILSAAQAAVDFHLRQYNEQITAH